MIREADILTCPSEVFEMLQGPPIENGLLNRTPLPSLEQLLEEIIAIPFTSMLAASGRHNLVPNKVAAQHQALNFNSCVESENKFCKDKGREVEAVNMDVTLKRGLCMEAKARLEEAEYQLAVAKRSYQSAESELRKSRDQASTHNKQLQESALKSNRNSHMQAVAELLVKLIHDIERKHSSTDLCGLLPFASMQSADQLSAKIGMDYKKIYALTVRQSVGISRFLYIFGYRFSLAYLDAVGDNSTELSVDTHCTKTQCREILCKLFGISPPSGIGLAAGKKPPAKAGKSLIKKKIEKKARKIQREDSMKVNAILSKCCPEEFSYAKNCDEGVVPYLVHRGQLGLLGTSTELSRGYPSTGKPPAKPSSASNDPKSTEITSRISRVPVSS